MATAYDYKLFIYIGFAMVYPEVGSTVMSSIAYVTPSAKNNQLLQGRRNH